MTGGVELAGDAGQGQRAMNDAAVPAQSFWVYKRGQLVLVFRSSAGVMLPTRGALDPIDDPHRWMARCPFASGQYLSVEWEPRIRLLQQRAADLVDFVELLEDRRYDLELVAPSQRGRPFRAL